MTTADAIARIWRDEAPRVVGTLARLTRDLSLAEEYAQDALVAALEEWPRSGVPERPGAWLTTAAKNRALNAIKRARMIDRKHALYAGGEPADLAPELEPMPDDALRLIFTACHPILAREARVALTLRLVAGLTTAEIARAFLSTEVAIGQRITRAKRAIADAGVPFEVPSGDDLAPRLASVLEVVYLVFNEGYSATAGDDLVRPALVDEAIRLGELLASLAPGEPEVLGLVALMLLQASRIAARVDARGDPVLLDRQDRSKWDRARIAAGLAALARADALGLPRGAYHLQAAIAASHARGTDWPHIAALYGELARVAPSPIVELNRAIAVSRADGPAAGLALLDALAGAPALASYHLLPAARADLLEQLGRLDEAAREFERAAALATNARQRDRLLQRARVAATRP